MRALCLVNREKRISRKINPPGFFDLPAPAIFLAPPVQLKKPIEVAVLALRL
jgi:hypothetical protein